MTLPSNDPIWTPDDSALLNETASGWNIVLTESAVARFEQYARILADVNQVMNLTRVPARETVTRHFLDSLSLAASVPLTPGTRLVDVGSGAGMPGVPLAIAFPRVQVTVLDSTLKRVRFVESAVRQLDLLNVTVLAGRAEELARQPAYATQFDIAVARAVAPLNRLVGWLAPFVRPQGLVVAYKSANIGEEIAAAEGEIKRNGLILERTDAVRVAVTEAPRTLVIFRRKDATTSSVERPRHNGRGRKK